MTPFTIDTRSPERAWEPFMAWLRSQGLEPRDLRAITLDPATMTGTATVMKRKNGKFYVEPGADEVATYTRSVPITTLPPLRAQRR